jgi:hypothetical protein
MARRSTPRPFIFPPRVQMGDALLLGFAPAPNAQGVIDGVFGTRENILGGAQSENIARNIRTQIITEIVGRLGFSNARSMLRQILITFAEGVPKDTHKRTLVLRLERSIGAWEQYIVNQVEALTRTTAAQDAQGNALPVPLADQINSLNFDAAKFTARVIAQIYPNIANLLEDNSTLIRAVGFAVPGLSLPGVIGTILSGRSSGGKSKRSKKYRKKKRYY